MRKTATIFSTAVILFAGKSFAEEVDYSKCANFVNPGQHKSMGGHFGAAPAMGGTMGYLPFKLNEDGSVQPHRDVVRYKQDGDKKQEVIVYEVPDYQAMMSKQNDGMSNPYKQPMRQAKVIIQRDEDGHIKEIINDQNLSEDDLKEQRQAQIESYESQTPDALKDIQSQWDSQKLFLPFRTLKQQKVSFEVKNGECSPSTSKNVVLSEPDPEGETQESTVFDVQVCRDIKNFIENNPEAGACFKKSLNDKISNIFKDHYKRLSEGRKPASGGIGGGIGIGGGGIGFGGGGYPGSGSYGGFGMGMGLETQLLMASNNGPEKFQKMMGNSPVIQGHKILESCKSFGLGDFLESPEEVSQQSSHSVSSGSQSQSK